MVNSTVDLYLRTFLSCCMEYWKTFKLGIPNIFHGLEELLSSRWQSPRGCYIFFERYQSKFHKKYFKTLQSTLLQFLWGHKRPRIKFLLLTRPKEQGGMGLTHFYNYYLASHLTRVIDWNGHGNSKDWVTLEDSLSSTPLKFSPGSHSRAKIKL